MIWPSRAPQSTLLRPPPYLPFPGTLPLTLPTSLPPLPLPPPPPQQLILEYHIRSHHQPFFHLPSPLSSTYNHLLQILQTIVPFHSSCPAILSITSVSFKAYPTLCGGVVTLTDVATLRRAHHRAFKKYSVGNRTASGTRTRIFDLSTLTFKPLGLRHLTSCAIVICIIKSYRAAAPEYLNSQSHPPVLDRHPPTPRVRSSSPQVANDPTLGLRESVAL